MTALQVHGAPNLLPMYVCAHEIMGGYALIYMCACNIHSPVDSYCVYVHVC